MGVCFLYLSEIYSRCHCFLTLLTQSEEATSLSFILFLDSKGLSTKGYQQGNSHPKSRLIWRVFQVEVVYLTLILSSDALWLMKMISLIIVLGGTLVVDLFWKDNCQIEEFPSHKSENES